MKGNLAEGGRGIVGAANARGGAGGGMVRRSRVSRVAYALRGGV